MARCGLRMMPPLHYHAARLVFPVRRARLGPGSFCIIASSRAGGKWSICRLIQCASLEQRISIHKTVEIDSEPGRMATADPRVVPHLDIRRANNCALLLSVGTNVVSHYTID